MKLLVVSNTDRQWDDWDKGYTEFLKRVGKPDSIRVMAPKAFLDRWEKQSHIDPKYRYPVTCQPITDLHVGSLSSLERERRDVVLVYRRGTRHTLSRVLPLANMFYGRGLPVFEIGDFYHPDRFDEAVKRYRESRM